MGCCNVKFCLDIFENYQGPEDKKMCISESLHPFSSIPCVNLIKEFLVNSQSGIISKESLQRACEALQISLDHSSDFMLALTGSSGSIKTEKLILTSLLLGRGDFSTKIRAFYDFCDEEAEGSILHSHLSRLLLQLLEVLCNLISLLSSRDIEYTNYVDYVSYLNSKKLCLLSLLMTTLPSRVSLDELTNHITKLGIQSLIFSPHGLRKLLQETTVEFSRVSEPPQLSESSDDSPEGVWVQVQLSNSTKSVFFYPDEDLQAVVQEFSVRNSLSEEEKSKLLQSVSKIQSDFL